MNEAILAGSRDSATDRRRFERAVGALWALGIVALGPMGSGSDRAHEALRERVTRKFPGGMGSYLFWTAGDARAFDARGRLTGSLTLHCSSDEVAESAVAVLQDHGVDAAAPPEPATVVIFPSAIARKSQRQ